MCNNSQSCFPDQLKLVKVFPVYKSGSKSDPNSYRPISILPTIFEIFEKHINKYLTAYLNKHSLIYKTQSGFHPKHSCQTALVKLTDKWMSCINQGDIIGSLFIDLKKAFDLVNRGSSYWALSVKKIAASCQISPYVTLKEKSMSPYFCPPPFRRKAEGHSFWLSVLPAVLPSVLPSPYRSKYLVCATPPTVLFRFF